MRHKLYIMRYKATNQWLPHCKIASRGIFMPQVNNGPYIKKFKLNLIDNSWVHDQRHKNKYLNTIRF